MFLKKFFVVIFGSLQVGIRALVWGIRARLREYLDSNRGLEWFFKELAFLKSKLTSSKKERGVWCVRPAELK